MKIKIQTLIILFSVILVIGAIFYKYSEYRFINNTATLYNETWQEELTITEDYVKEIRNVGLLVQQLFSASSSADALSTTEELQSLIGILENKADDYLNTLIKNDEKYNKLESFSWYLVGSDIEKAKSILQNQAEYYNNELEGAREGLATVYFYQNLFQVFGDYYKLSDFTSKLASSPQQNAKTYFSEIASLSKYEKAEFKFRNEDEMRQYHPEEYQVLLKYKNFFASSYSLIRQYNAGQVDGTAYSEGYNRMLQDEAELNIDFAGLFESSEDRSRIRTSAIISSVTEQINQAYLLNENQPIYPFVSQIPQMDFYPVQCQLYNYKASILYPNIAKKPVESENMENLLRELGTISPKTDMIDRYFDSSLVEFENTEEEIKFVCKGKFSDSRYEFIIQK